MSIRIGDERFIKNILKSLQVNTILDIACGAGKDILVDYSQNCIGIDIEGYPTELALKKGYKQALVYNAPDYSFKIDKEPDVITAINLNAHLPYSALEKILKMSIAISKKDAHLILINEYFGGYSYEKHFLNTSKKDALVNVMEHHFFEKEESFLAKLNNSFPNLKLIEREPLTTIVSSIQYKYYFVKGKQYPPFLFYLADMFLSLWNSAKIKFGKKSQSAFLVGYVFKISK